MTSFQNVQKHANSITDNTVRDALLCDLIALAYAWTPEIALKMRRLFFIKWDANDNEKVKIVIQQFKAQWTNNGVSLWSRGHGHDCVINNNGLESTNNVLKKEVTRRALLPILKFLSEMQM